MKEFCLTLHILLASLWVGGMLFMVIVLIPYIRKLPDNIHIIKAVGIRYSIAGTFIGLPLLFLTGLCNMNTFNIKFWDVFSATKNNPYLFTLKHKIYLFFITAVLAVFHDLVLGLRSDKSKKYRILARVIGLTNLVIGILIVYLAVKLRFGG
jgi:putative copper export protein